MKGKYPFSSLSNYSIIKKEINNGILYDSLKDNKISDLIIKLLNFNKDKRISWNDYFNYNIKNLELTKKKKIFFQ